MCHSVLMDKHYLTPLFQPEAIAVFVGKTDDPEHQIPQARALVESITAQRYSGKLVFIDPHTTGTLADLAQTRADLAIIALPPEEALAALEVAGRIKCKAALMIGSGIPADMANDMHQVARRHGIHLLGPNSLGFQRPRIGLNASVVGPLAAQARWR